MAIVQTLVEKYEADVNAQDSTSKRTPLHELVVFAQNISEFTSFFWILKKHGVDLDIQDDDGKTALHLAYEEGKSEIVNLLIENGADTTIRDLKGKTPFELGQDNALYRSVHKANMDKIVQGIVSAALQEYGIVPEKNLTIQMQQKVLEVKINVKMYSI